MPGNVDERVVEMRIDNKQFESGAKTTISTLEKLERALHLKGDSDAIDRMARSVSNFDATPMANSIDKVTGHFDLLQIAGMRVIENLTDSIYNFATRTVKGLTIDQVSEGWDKYEKKTESVQSIMAATRDLFDDEAEQMKFVNDQLDRMMWFTDETSYNFVDMADNVGKFLAAGVGLGEGENLSTPFSAMMGIAAWGASAGAKPTEVSRAMYNISQAMGAGAMKAVDWKSIENAGMATLEFKQNVLDTAEALGKIRKVGNDAGYIDEAADAIIKYSSAVDKADSDLKDKELFDAKSFREGLSEGWFDTEVMTEVFKRYGEFADLLYEGTQATGAEATTLMEILDRYRSYLKSTNGDGSGFDWSRYKSDVDSIEELQIAIENLSKTQWEYSEQGFRMGQEAKTFSDALEATKDAVSSKWMRTFQWVFGDYREAKDFWTEITDRLYTLFAEGGDMRNDILEAWYWAGGRNSLFNLDAENGPIGALWNLLDAIGTVAGPIRDALFDVLGISDTKGIAAFGEMLAKASERFREVTENFGLSEEAQQGLKNIFSVIFRGAKLVLDGIGGVLGIFGKFALGIGEVIDLLLSLASGNYTLEEAQEILMGSLYRILDFFLGIKDTIIGIPESLKKVAHYIEQVQAGWGPEFMEKSFNSLNGIEKVLARIGERFPALSSVLKIASEYFGKFIERIRTLKSGLPNAEALLASLSNYFTQLKNSLTGVNVDLSGAKGLLGRAGEFANVLLTALFGDMTSFKERASNFLSKAIGFIVDIIKGIKISDVMSAVNAGIKLGFLGGLLDIVRSFHILTNEFKSIPEAITDTLGSLQKSFESTSYLKIAVALGILAGAIYALSKVPSDDFMRVVLGLGILAMVLQKVSKGINIFSGSNNTGDTITKGLKANIKLMPDLAATILALAVALGVMAHAVVAFKKNGIGITGLIAPIAMLIVTLGAMVGFLYLLKKFELKDVGKSFALLITVFSIIGKVTKMAKAVKDVEIWHLVATLGGMIGIIAALALLMRFSSGFEKFKGNQLLQVAAIFVAVGLSVRLIVSALKPLAKLEFGQLLQGLIGVGVLLLMLGGMMGWMSRLDGSNTGGLIKTAAAMAIMAVSLKLLIGPLLAMALLPFGNMLKGIAIIGILLLMLGGLTAWMSRLDGSKGGGLIKIVGAVALLSVALAVLLPSVMTFTMLMIALAAVLNGKMVLKLLLLSGVMILLGAGLVVAGVGVALLGIGLLAASVSALLFGTAILAIASALDKLGTAFPQLIQGLADAGKLMTAENAWNIGKGAIAFIALAAGIFLLAKAFGALFEKTDVVGKLGTFGGKLVSSIGTILRNVGTKITEHIPELLKVLAALGVAAGLYLIGAIPKIASFAVQAILTLFESIHQGIRANKGVLEHSIFGIVEVALEIILDSGTWVFSVIRGLISTVATGILNWVAEQVEKIDLFGIGEKLGKTIRGIADDLPSTEEIMKQWSDQKSSNEEWLQQFVPPAGELQDISQTVPENIGTGILAGQSSVDDAITTVKDSALSIVGMLPPAMETNGEDAMSGLNTGIVNFWNSGVIQDNLGTITDGINLQTRLGLGERSPSKIAAEAGAFYVIGLAQGIADNAKLPLDAIDDTTDPMADALRNAMMQVATVADDNFEFTPTITPVVDLSNVGYAAGSIGSMFGNASLSASLSRSSAAQASRYSNGSYGSGNNAVISEMQGLGARVDALGAAITNMQIVLDSGVLVGATSAKMDARLGLLAARKGRGN